MKNESKKWLRNCPTCGKLISHVNKNALYRAMKSNKDCKKCAETNPIRRKKLSDANSGKHKPDELRKYPLNFKFERTCPVCGKLIIYKSYQGYECGLKRNSSCQKCGCGWMKCQTKETNESIAKMAKGVSKSNKGCTPWNKGLTKEDHPSLKLVGDKRKGIKHTNEVKKRISDASLEHWQDKYYRELVTTRVTEACTDERRNDMRLFMIRRIENAKFNGNQMFPAYNINSIPIIEQKAKELGITDLQHAENGGEFYIKELGYWVDGYSKDKNIVIEYYEKFHKKNEHKDLRRQTEITNLLKCKFIIINE
jgi:endogenous inhibitor of DNA gyrase (YacG/DUF329 family)